MNVLAGKIPDVAAYRSALLADLRIRAADGQRQKGDPVKSPHIEPTIERYVEMMPDDPVALRINDAVKQARRAAVRKSSLPELQEFARLSAKARYDLLIDRYSVNLHLPDSRWIRIEKLASCSESRYPMADDPSCSWTTRATA